MKNEHICQVLNWKTTGDRNWKLKQELLWLRKQLKITEFCHPYERRNEEKFGVERITVAMRNVDYEKRHRNRTEEFEIWV